MIWWAYGNLQNTRFLDGFGRMALSKFLKFRYSEITGNAIISTYSRECLACLVQKLTLRPISVLPLVSKIFERIICNQMQSHISTLLSNLLSGF